MLIIAITLLSCNYLYAKEPLINLSLKEAKFTEIIAEIEKQCGFTFMYDDTMKEILPVTIILKDTPLSEALQQIFETLKIKYQILGTQIILKNNEMLMVADQKLIPKKIRGVVTDEQGNPVSGVAVLEKNSTNGTITNSNGEFYIETQPGSSLIFRHISYKTYESETDMKLNSRIVLYEDQVDIDEIVVLGYGTAPKKDLTGSVSSISSETIKNQGLVKDFLQALQGQIAGADITTENAPGDGSTIHIRGYNSLNASNAPLIVVDDAPYSGNFTDINPNEIEKIDILKDASSTAIYGSRGANGVVIITTKRGKDNTKVTAEYNGYFGAGKSAGNFNMMDGETFLRYKIASGSIFDAIQERVIAKKNYTDWQKLMFSGTAYKNDHSLSLNMSSGRSLTSVQLGYSREQGIIDNMTFRRISGRFTGDIDVAKLIRIGYSASITHSKRENGDVNVWRNGTLLDPLTEVYDEKGGLRFYNSGWNLNALHSNPMFDASRENVNNQTMRDRILGSAYLSWQLFENLNFRSSLTYDFTGSEEGAYYSSTSQNRSGSSSGAFYQKPTERSLTFTNNLYFAKNFVNHNVKINLVHDMQRYTYDIIGASGLNIPYPGLWYNVNEAQLNLITHANKWDWSILSFMGRINYSYNSKYLLTFTGRADGSSKLAKGHKWGFFPSLAFAWRISEEAFLKDLPELTDLKIRVGWGISGNTAINPYVTYGKLGRFPYNFGITSDNSAIGYIPTEIENQTLGWERTSEINLGLDFGFFKNRISGSVDVYRKNTFDLLMKRNLPTTSGYNDVWQNVGQTRNTGVEFFLQSVIVSKKYFSWSANLTLNYNKNEIVQLFNGTQDSPSNKWFIGQPIDVEWITKYVGVWQASEAEEAALYSRLPGQSKLLDANNDKVIDQNDLFVYNRIPKMVGGVSSSMKFRNVDFSIYMYTRLGYGKMLGIITMPDFGTANWNQLNYNFWTPDNPTNDGPKPAETRDAYAQGSSYAFRDLSFIRLKNISLGYTLPGLLTQRLKGNTLRVYVAADNPLVINRKDYIGIDPENANSPLDARPLRSVIIGINAKF